MTSFEQTLLQEVAALPKTRRADVLAFVRYLRLTLMENDELERRFETALDVMHESAMRQNITEKDIQDEIRAVRDEHARGA